MESIMSQHNGHSHNGYHEKLRSPAFLSSFELDFAPVDRPRIEMVVTDLLQAVGEDVQRPGLEETPRRVARMYEELLSGYRTDPLALINEAIFPVEHDDMVIVRDIEFSSLCEHHLLPFIGHAHVAYIPRGKVIGLSKIPRIVDMFAHRLQLQERLTRQIANFIQEVLDPQGVAVVLDGKHMCSTIRGVEKHDSSMTTSAMLGTFLTRDSARTEFLTLITR
ncbi:MAG: GTP cyclohydrolase I FolE [Chloroflexi bacterium]|nr:GTP cyclohydrolase I FolE [Chloroflexota bacterium]